MRLPDTIKHPDTFNNSPACGFDGVFDLSFTQGCFGEGKITPMDFDGVVERKGNFLLFETKCVGVPIPKGQLYTLEAPYKLNCFTIVMIEGKDVVESAKVWCQPGFNKGAKMKDHAPATPERMSKFCHDWFEYANKNRFDQVVDASFLNKRITKLEDCIDTAKSHLECAVFALGGTIIWQNL